MRMVNGVVGCILLALAVIHYFVPNHMHLLAVYGVGAGLAFATLIRDMGMRTARLLAVATTAVMFFYFAGFFKMAPHFHEYWYRTGEALEAVGLLFSAFAMIPILSCYSCVLKADCRQAIEQEKRPAFFRVPESIQDSAHS